MITALSRIARRGLAVVPFAGASLLMATGLMQTANASSARMTAENPHCVYSVTSSSMSCFESYIVARTMAKRGLANTSNQTADVQSGDVIGATVFEDINYGGASLTITVPSPCVKDGKMDWWLDLEGFWRNRISSVQAWGNCWIWLYPESGDRAGPYKENHPDVGNYINDRTITVGLS